MIERLQRIATFLARFRLLVVALAGIFLALLLLSILDNPWLHGDVLLIPSILGFCWALILYSVGELFITVPPSPASDAGFRSRLSIRLRRGMLWLLGLFTVLSTIALFVLSYQLLRAWL